MAAAAALQGDTGPYDELSNEQATYPGQTDVSVVNELGRELLKLCSQRVGKWVSDWSILHQNILDIKKRADDANIPTIDFVNTTNSNGKDSLMHVCQLTDNPDLVRTLLEMRADIRTTTNRGHTALHFAASKGRQNLCPVLLEAGAAVRVITVTGDSVLSLASKRLEPDIKAMLEAQEARETTSLDFREDSETNPNPNPNPARVDRELESTLDSVYP